ncbi:MAG: V-type ATP synthase subunit F [Gammaproteobacteria bacterium]|nr:V-type ATP synthase subunit F [Gammaproteobacteria bacterium]MDH4313221.1 V-type ATP synthase subunit F [Gammaproteobacteria bacterium]MDH5213573.1 V-type ATP synthase subunit F [Gammaproteobacteria bacterium]MDH5501501.1 V-type ATP synthase subunit F [Gammaproteobacteria bacterium]
MPAPVFIGDEVTAAGYRLAGARVLVPDSGDDRDVSATFAEALRSADLVLISAACAGELPADLLDRAVRAADPLLLIVPDAAGRVSMPDVAADVGRALGIEP